MTIAPLALRVGIATAATGVVTGAAFVHAGTRIDREPFADLGVTVYSMGAGALGGVAAAGLGVAALVQLAHGNPGSAAALGRGAAQGAAVAATIGALLATGADSALLRLGQRLVA